MDDSLDRELEDYGVASEQLNAWIAGTKALALVSAAHRAGVLDALRTPQSIPAISRATGLSEDRAADLCLALLAHGVFDQEADLYRFSPAFATLMSPDAAQPLPVLVEAAMADAHMLEGMTAGQGVPVTVSSEDALRLAEGTTLRPGSRMGRRLMTAITDQLPEVAAPLRKGGRHLELGCGVGGRLLGFLITFPAMTAVGVELDDAILAVTRRRAAELGVADRVDLRLGDARDLTDASAFDSVFWSQMFFPAESRSATLAAALRALKPGGHLMTPVSFAEPPAICDEQCGQVGRDYTLFRLSFGLRGVPVQRGTELRAELHDAGFRFVRFTETPFGSYLVVQRPQG